MFFKYTSEVGPVLLKITNGSLETGCGKRQWWHDITSNAGGRV